MPSNEDRAMTHDRIAIDPKVKFGKPCIKGTRVPVEMVLRALGSRGSEESVLADYPNLSREDIRAALLFAADELHRPFVSDFERASADGNGKPTIRAAE
jgi:uncharacterized protein (DUF433 family)